MRFVLAHGPRVSRTARGSSGSHDAIVFVVEENIFSYKITERRLLTAHKQSDPTSEPLGLTSCTTCWGLGLKVNTQSLNKSLEAELYNDRRSGL